MNEQQEQPNTVAIHVVAPLAAMAATWAVRKVLDSGYRRLRGHNPPSAHDPNASFANAVMWAAITAATAAVVEVSVFRLVSRED